MINKLLSQITGPINLQVSELKKQIELLVSKRKALDLIVREQQMREQELNRRELELSKKEALFSDQVLQARIMCEANKMSGQIINEYQARLDILQQREAEMARKAIDIRQQLIKEWEKLLQARQKLSVQWQPEGIPIDWDNLPNPNNN